MAKKRLWLLFWAFQMAMWCGGRPAVAQTLAHKGWAGSGLTIDPWWKGAVFYQLDPLTFHDAEGDGSGGLNGLTQRLDSLRGLGVDAVVLSRSEAQAPGKGAASASKAALGSKAAKEEDFDNLEQEASRRRMHVIIDVPLSARQSAQDTLASARFWLSRGAGGLRLVADSEAGGTLGQAETADRVRQLRRLCAGYVGDRVLLWDVAGGVAAQEEARAASRQRRESAFDKPQLTVDHAAAAIPAWNALALRSLVSGAVAPDGVLVSDTPNSARSLSRLSAGMENTQRMAVAKMLATVMLAGREAPMILDGQEIGMAASAATPEPGSADGTTSVGAEPNTLAATVAAEDANPGSLLNWYRKLSALRQEGYALKDGALTLVDTGYPEVVAWVRKGSTAGARPVLVMCNLSGHSVLISVEQQLKQIGLKPTSGMRPIALSYTGVNPSYTATGIDLPAYGIYLGEILQPGLEDAPAPYVAHRRGR